MRILRVISSIDPRGGGPIEAARAIDTELTRLGHTVESVCLDSADEPFIAKYPVRVHALGPSHLGYRYCARLVPWIRQNRQRFDAVVVDGLWQYHGFAVRAALSGTDTPYFVFAHGMLAPWFKYTYPLKHLKKWLYWLLAEYRVLRDACAVLFTCEEECESARDSFSPYKVDEAVCGLGTSPPPGNCPELVQKFLDAHPNLKNKRLILFLGRLHEIKGCDLLLSAFAKVAHDDMALVVAGPDSSGLIRSLQAQAQDLGIADRVTWTGMLRGDEKWGAMYASHVFCLPSHHENFGMAVAEALACGKPVLISNKVNIWREIETDAAGFVDDDTEVGTLRNLERWIALDAVGRDEMASRAQRCFAQRFQIRQMAERLAEIVRGA